MQFFLLKLLFSVFFQSADIDFRHELMHRINKLDTEVELGVLENHQHSSISGYDESFDHYTSGKEYYCPKRENGGDNDDTFLRPPCWEDITSSIQNIDPENAIMLSALTGATQVKLETSDDSFLESFSSPLISPLEIKTEKGYYQHHNGNHGSHHNSMNVNSNHSSYPVQSHYHHPQVHHLSGYHEFNHLNDGHAPNQQYSNNYYNWQQNQHTSSHQVPVYGTKYSPQNNLSASISRLMYVPPLTPPSSDPGSPGNSIQVSCCASIGPWHELLHTRCDSKKESYLNLRLVDKDWLPVSHWSLRQCQQLQIH